MTFVKLGEGSLGECSLREGSLGKDPWGGVAGGGIPGECSAELRLLRLCWVFFFWSVCLNIGSLPPPPPAPGACLPWGGSSRVYSPPRVFVSSCFTPEGWEFTPEGWDFTPEGWNFTPEWVVSVKLNGSSHNRMGR